jgi:DNA helicase-2/ATP-dependent DNA helicase PcrA
MDFDDMLNYTYVILNKYPGILAKFQNQYKYFNVDEAQDTSFIQHEIIRLLVQKNGNIFMVGDEDQSIYGFRAAFPKALLDFENNYKNAKVLLMERNYRSTKKIVEGANRFIKQNKDRYQKNMFCENADGIEIKQTELKDLNEQYKYIIESIKNGTNKSIAILYRNNDSAVPIVDALEHENIPFFIRENKPTFFSHFVINDIICFIRLARNNADIEAFEKIYYKMNCIISKQMFEYAKQNLRENVFDALLEIVDLKDWVRNKINELKLDFIRLKDLKPLQAIEYMEYKMGYSYNLNNLSNKGYAKEPLVQKLNALKSIASNRKSLNDFVGRLSQLEDIMQKSSGKSGVVTLTTVHSSKGLEFDKVIIVDIIEGQFPSQESIKLLEEKCNRSLFEEEVRLFYVGITRARNELEIITSNLLNKHPIRTSRFVKYLILKPKETVKRTNVQKPKKQKVISNEELQRYTVKTNVVHKTFGNGSIENLEKGIIDVDFENYGLKKLSLLACLENKLIKTE